MISLKLQSAARIFLSLVVLNSVGGNAALAQQTRTDHATTQNNSTQQPGAPETVRPKPIAAPSPRSSTDKRIDDSDEETVARRNRINVATDLLRQTANEAKSWTDQKAAASALSQIAELLWETDADAARVILVSAWDTTARIKVEDDLKASAYRNSNSPRNESRREVLLVARRRANDLAEKWLTQLSDEEEAGRTKRARGAFDDRTGRSSVLLDMATQLVEENPQLAAQLATESLRDGISFGFQIVLLKLQEKDAQLAEQVFRRALARLQQVGAAEPDELLVLNSFLYTPGRTPAANTTEREGSFQLAVSAAPPRVRAMAETNPALALEFLRLAADLLLGAPLPVATANPAETARAQISAINALLYRMRERLPQQAIAVQERLTALGADARFTTVPRPTLPDTPPAPRQGESDADYRERRIEQLAEAAAREPAGLGRDILYAKAAVATNPARYERGLELTRKINDRDLRAGVANYVAYRATMHFIKEKDLVLARKITAQNTDPTQRAASLVVGAQHFIRAKDHVAAGEWLRDATKAVSDAEKDADAARIALGIVAAYARFDDVAALEALRNAVSIINRNEFVSLTQERAPEARRFSGFVVPDATSGTGGFGLTSALEAFDSKQFESVRATLSRIESPEARGISLIVLARKQLRAATGRDSAATIQ